MRLIRPPWRGPRAVFVTLVGVVALFVAAVAPVTVGAAATAQPAAPVAAAPLALPTTTVHGGGFQLHSVMDPNFCAEVGGGAADLRSVTLEPCVAASAQRWTFSWLATGLNQMIETQGMCVDVSGRKPGDGVAVAVTYCKNTKAEKLTFSLTGQIEFAKGCLSFPRNAAGAAVFLEACDSMNNRQFWKLSQ